MGSTGGSAPHGELISRLTWVQAVAPRPLVGLFVEDTASPGGPAQVLSVAGHGFNRRLRARSQLGGGGSLGKLP